MQFQLDLPAEIVWVHVALATLTWVGIVLAAMQVGAPSARPPRWRAQSPGLRSRVGSATRSLLTVTLNVPFAAR